MTPAVRAALFAAASAGRPSDDPLVVADSNNTIVWLRPHPVMAKVARRTNEASVLHDYTVAQFLFLAGAPVAPPLAGVLPLCDENGILITLWNRLDDERRDRLGSPEIGDSLRELHQALRQYRGELPTFRDRLESARRVLHDDAHMRALRTDDRRLLRAAYESLTTGLQRCAFVEQPLHGEPHDRNLLASTAGVKWIDFEGTCVGPLEWDLAFLPDEAVIRFPGHDPHLLQLLRALNSVRTATWCWARYEEVPELRWHAEFHLERVRTRSNA